MFVIPKIPDPTNKKKSHRIFREITLIKTKITIYELHEKKKEEEIASIKPIELRLYRYTKESS